MSSATPQCVLRVVVALAVLVGAVGCGAGSQRATSGRTAMAPVGSAASDDTTVGIAWRDDESDQLRVDASESELLKRFGRAVRRFEPSPRTHFLSGEMYAAPTPLEGDRVLLLWRPPAGAGYVDAYWTGGRDDLRLRIWRDAESERYRRDPSGATVRERLGPSLDHSPQDSQRYELVGHRFRAPTRRQPDRLLQVWEAPRSNNGISDAYWASAAHVDRAALAPPDVRTVVPQDAAERAAALEGALGEMDALRKGFDTPFDRVEERGRTLLRTYHSDAERARIYFQLAHVEAQSGFPHPDKVVWYVQQAMARPLDKEKRILLYHYWGNALESAHEAAEGEALRAARRQIVEPYLRGLNEAVEYVKELHATPLPELPPERKDLPGADNRALAFPQLAQAKRDRLLERIADLQHGFIEQTAYLYSRAPRDRKEIRELAGEMVSNTRAIARLMARVNARVREEGGNEPRGDGGGERVPASSPATKETAREWSGLRARRKPATTRRASGPALIRQLIDAQIAQLRQESTAESVKQLWQVEMFYWPGYRFDGAGSIALPLAADVGAHWVDQILSNRRFLKVFDELSRMPPAHAAEVINNQVRQSLPVYRSLLAKDMATLKRNRAALPPGTPSTAGLSLQISNNRDGTPTLNGVRLQLLSLALVAGNLKLTEAEVSVRELVQEAESQRALLYQPDPVLLEADRFSILADASLYQRQILATALLGAAGPPIEAKKPDAGVTALPYRVEVLSRFDTRVTRYDQAAGAEGANDPANQEGQLRLRVLQPVTDEQWQEVMKTLGLKTAP